MSRARAFLSGSFTLICVYHITPGFHVCHIRPGFHVWLFTSTAHPPDAHASDVECWRTVHRVRRPPMWNVGKQPTGRASLRCGMLAIRPLGAQASDVECWQIAQRVRRLPKRLRVRELAANL